MTQCGKIHSSQTGTDDNIIQRQKYARIKMYTHNFFILHILCATTLHSQRIIHSIQTTHQTPDPETCYIARQNQNIDVGHKI
jgi:hypothetical protein